MSKALLTKKHLEELAELARIKVDDRSEDKLLSDLQKILEHFEELKEIETEKIEPLAGGTTGANVLREDKESEEREEKGGKLINQFPDKEGRFLKVPPVFE